MNCKSRQYRSLERRLRLFWSIRCACFPVEQILVIENAGDIGPDDHELMRKRLEEQGVQEIASVSLHE